LAELDFLRAMVLTHHPAQVSGAHESGENLMKATIWHNPACGTSRKTLAILESLSRVELTVVEYLKTPPTAEQLDQLYRDAGITPQQGLRLRGTNAAERGLPNADDATVLAAMVAEPILIERPLVATEKGVRLCRPQDVVLEIL
jgi:arsenate reductase